MARSDVLFPSTGFPLLTLFRFCRQAEGRRLVGCRRLLKLAAIDAVGEYLRPTDKNCTLRRMNRLLGDTALRQGLLDLLQTRVCHLRAGEVERGEMLEVLDLFQARVRHLCEAEVEHFCVSINYSVRAGNRNRLLILRDRQFPWLFPKCGFPQQV